MNLFKFQKCKVDFSDQSQGDNNEKYNYVFRVVLLDEKVKNDILYVYYGDISKDVINGDFNYPLLSKYSTIFLLMIIVIIILLLIKTLILIKLTYKFININMKQF